jgi:predicted MFS family arabinose efflux permease
MIESRWLILAMLFIARFALGYLFQSAGSVAPFLLRELGIDFASVGMLVGVFLLPGVVISVPSAYLARSFGDKGAATTGMALMMAGGILAGIAPSYPILFVSRIVSGTGGAILVVVLSKMTADWFADKELFLGMAIFIIGWPVGIAAGQATQGPLAELISWHTVFIVSALFVGLPLLLVAMFYRAPHEHDQSPPSVQRRLSGMEIVIICLAGLCWMFLNGAYLVMLSFGPAHLIELGIPVARANFIVSIMSWVTAVALPLGGFVATRYKVPNLVMFGGLAFSIALCAAIPFWPAPLLTFTSVGVALAFASPVVGSLPAEVLAPRNRASGFGLYYFWYFIGMPILLPIAGMLRDRTGSVTTSLLYAAALLFGCLVLAAVFRFMQARWFNNALAALPHAG